MTTLGLALVGLATVAVWEWWRRGTRSGGEKEEVAPWSVRAYSFQSKLSFSDAKRMLEVGELGKWYERDSAWYDQLLSCPARAGMRMNLYRFENEWVLELKISEADADRAGVEAFAEETLLPAFDARGVKETGPVN